MTARSGFDIRVETVVEAGGEDFAWFHPRAAAIPRVGKDGDPAVVMTLQKHLQVSDFYSGLYVMRSDDLGAAWTGPDEIPELRWRKESPDIILSASDVTPGWHEPTGTLLAIGARQRYTAEGALARGVPKSVATLYACYDPRSGAWSEWRMLAMPEHETRFGISSCSSSQWLVEDDGSLLLPIYFCDSHLAPCYSVTVARCSFDGQTMRCLELGDELRLDVPRGLCEPSLAHFGDRTYMTIRNDKRAYVTKSEDGLHFEAIKPWVFDDGTELGSYNTQQHWLTLGDDLYLVYTRLGANNDHIVRHRAPLFMAQVDPGRLCVVRDTERVVLPERGAAMGNFGVNVISWAESWVTVGELLCSGEDGRGRARGSAAVFLARVMSAGRTA